MSCARCNSAACNGDTTTCLGCGTIQCMANGLGKGSCSVCHFGILVGWSSWRKQCAYKGCKHPAAFHYVTGSVKNVCHEHATRPKITIHPRNFAERITLAEYAARGLRAMRFECGVVMPGQEHKARSHFLSEVDEEVIRVCAEGSAKLKEIVIPGLS